MKCCSALLERSFTRPLKDVVIFQRKKETLDSNQVERNFCYDFFPFPPQSIRDVCSLWRKRLKIESEGNEFLFLIIL